MWTCSSATGSMRTSPRPIPRSVAGADVGVVVLDHVDRGLLRAGGPAVDADVGCDEILLVVGMGPLVLADQLVERLLLAAVRPGPDNGRPALRRRNTPVEGIVPGFTRLSRQGVG